MIKEICGCTYGIEIIKIVWNNEDDDDDDDDIESLNGGQFHSHLRDIFAPQVVRYIDLMESSIAQSIHSGFEKEMWKPQG